jgi:adenylate kinase
LLGAPGVGKGTQADLLCQRLGACHLSTGDIFRASKSLAPGERSAGLSEALTYMSKGLLVPDTTVLAIVRERLACLKCPGGFLLDGFPRTVAQAEALEKLLALEHLPLTGVIDFELPIQEIVERLAGRRTCAGCKAVYHLVHSPPLKKDVCDRCGGALYQREDDRPESIRVRMNAYQESTLPLIQFYSQRGLLISIKADGAPPAIFQRTLAALNGSARVKKEKHT